MLINRYDKLRNENDKVRDKIWQNKEWEMYLT